MEKIWLKSYPPGVPAEIDPNQYQSIGDIWRESVGKFGARPAYSCMGKTLSFADADGYADAFAGYLQGVLKLPKGARVALMMPNILQYPVCIFGALKAGYTVVNVNPLYTPRELEHQLKDSGAEVIVILENFAKTLQEVRSAVPVKHIVVTSLGDMLGFPKSHIVNFVVKNVKKMVPAYQLDGTLKFTDMIRQGAAQKVQAVKVTHDDIAFLQYTGGTTGVSKGAMLTHNNIVANVLQSYEWQKGFISEGIEVIITALPLYHIFSLTANCITQSKLGSENVLITNPKDMPGFVKELGKHKFSIVTGVNTLFNGLLNTPGFDQLDFSNLKLTLGGGTAVQKVVADKWHKVTGCVLLEAYGLTETSPGATINPLNLTAYNGTIGLPISSTEIDIRDDDKKSVALGERGEICIRGPQVMKGYWNRPDETAKVMHPDGFFASGDIGIMDDKGFIKIVDRKKDMILVSGFNVYPNEVEDVISRHPGVLEVAAVGVPSEQSGEAVKIFVVKKDPNLSAEDLIEFSKKELTGYKRPHQVEFRTELPKTNVGKILRRALRDEKKV